MLDSLTDYAVLPLERQHQIMDKTLGLRLKKLLPSLMDECGIDLWLILCRENNEDPVFSTMTPAAQLCAHCLSGFAFARNENGTVDAFNLGYPNARYDPFYIQEFVPQGHDPQKQWDYIGKLIHTRNPQRIGINTAENCTMAEGLTKTLYDKLAASIGKGYVSRLVCAQELAVRWMETRTREELVQYWGIYDLAVKLFEAGLSRQVIRPGVTTTADVEWWLKGQVHGLGLRESFTNQVRVERRGFDGLISHPAIILPGDLVHCDFGIEYLGLATDMQRMVYVLRSGENQAPQGICQAYAECTRFQSLCAEQFVAGRMAWQIHEAAISQGRVSGLRPKLYSHPIGYRCHAPGPLIGLPDHQKPVPFRGDHVLHGDTCFALELNNISYVKEWEQDVVMYQEETVVFTDAGRVEFLDPRHAVLRCI